MERQTKFSPCRKYRYTLWRDWEVESFPEDYDAIKRAEGYAMFIGLNPSTADETQDDPTIRRCVGFAKDWGYGAPCMTNLFAFRATDPKEMKAEKYPVSLGWENTNHLLYNAQHAGIVICAWGTHGTHINRDKAVITMLNQSGIELHCLGITKDRHPKHPLYLKKDSKPILFHQE